MTLVWALLAVGAGFLLALQPSVNAEIARLSGAVTIAAFVSVGITLTFLTVPAVLASRDANSGWVIALPWWIVLGGLAGVAIVMSGVFIGPRIGIVLLTASIVFGQAMGSIAVDTFGWFNQPVRELSIGRVAGISCVLFGLVLLLRAE